MASRPRVVYSFRNSSSSIPLRSHRSHQILVPTPWPSPSSLLRRQATPDSPETAGCTAKKALATIRPGQGSGQCGPVLVGRHQLALSRPPSVIEAVLVPGHLGDEGSVVAAPHHPLAHSTGRCSEAHGKAELGERERRYNKCCWHGGEKRSKICQRPTTGSDRRRRCRNQSRRTGSWCCDHMVQSSCVAAVWQLLKTTGTGTLPPRRA